MKRTKGFTLIEVMIVAAIVGILAAVALPVIFPQTFPPNTTQHGTKVYSTNCYK